MQYLAQKWKHFFHFRDNDKIRECSQKFNDFVFVKIKKIFPI